MPTKKQISVKKNEEAYVAQCGEAFFYCVVGRDGVTDKKTEGDWKTPAGTFRITDIFYRPDRVERINSSIPTHALNPDDGWCDDPNSPLYNKFVKLPYEFSAEKLWRDDELYDVILVLDYNTRDPIPGVGSAIFIHVAKEGMEYTKGCVALKKPDLLNILGNIGSDTEVLIEL